MRLHPMLYDIFPYRITAAAGKTRTMSPYHEGKFKVVTVKGTFFDCKCQAVEDRDEDLNKNNNTLNSMLQCFSAF